MTNSMSNAGRRFDDDDLPPPHAALRHDWSRPGARPPLRVSETNRLAPPTSPTLPPPLLPGQRACYEALSLALEEGHVYAAVTGPAGAGKTTVLDAVLLDRPSRSLRCIRISDPARVGAKLASQIEEIAYTEASKPENLERHVLLAIDDADSASDELLHCLARLSTMREPGRRLPQVLLVGRPELWQRLTVEAFQPLARRIAIRAVLPPLSDERDPWASLEEEVSQAMTAREGPTTALSGSFGDPVFDHAFATNFPAEAKAAGLPLSDEPVPPPLEYALFPDPPEQLGGHHESRRRLLLPVLCLVVTLVAFVSVLSFYQWPSLFDDMPWSDPPAPSFPLASSGSPYANIPVRHGGLGPETRSRPAEKPPAPVVAAPPPKPPEIATAAPIPAPAPAPVPVATPSPPEPPARVAVPEPIAPLPRVVTAEAPPPRPAAPPPAPPVLPPQTAATIAPAQPPPVQEAPALAALQARAPTASPAIHQAGAVVRPAPLPAAVVALLLQRGEQQAAIGDISAARLLFERAAEAGSPSAALRLARTFDPMFLSAAEATVLSNPAIARRWYARAAELGDREASVRLKAINEGR